MWFLRNIHRIQCGYVAYRNFIVGLVWILDSRIRTVLMFNKSYAKQKRNVYPLAIGRLDYPRFNGLLSAAQ